MRYQAIPNLDARAYSRHALHGEHCAWVEKNCYVDIWIEILHSLGLEPMAMLPFTACVDFEGDQWTFFKPSHDELRDLYGVDVQELSVWRPLLEHVQEHLSAGKILCIESDAFWLPDTSGTDYRRRHAKTTIGLADIDPGNQRLGYFHNAGYYTLSGEDFVNTFRVGAPADPTFLPLFAEVVRIDRIARRSSAELVQMSLQLWRRHLRHQPASNPVQRFQQRFVQDLPDMQEQGLARYHAWAFSTIRQLGAAFELAAMNLRWLQQHGVADVEVSAEAFEGIATAAKVLILKAARAVNARRVFDGTELFGQLDAAWERGMNALPAALQG